METSSKTIIKPQMKTDYSPKQAGNSNQNDINIEEHSIDTEMMNKSNSKESMVITRKTFVQQKLKLDLNLVKIEEQLKDFGINTDEDKNETVLTYGGKLHSCNHIFCFFFTQ